MLCKYWTLQTAVSDLIALCMVLWEDIQLLTIGTVSHVEILSFVNFHLSVMTTITHTHTHTHTHTVMLESKVDYLEKQLQETRLSHKQEVDRLHKDLQEGRATVSWVGGLLWQQVYHVCYVNVFSAVQTNYETKVSTVYLSL